LPLDLYGRIPASGVHSFSFLFVVPSHRQQVFLFVFNYIVSFIINSIISFLSYLKDLVVKTHQKHVVVLLLYTLLCFWLLARCIKYSLNWWLVGRTFSGLSHILFYIVFFIVQVWASRDGSVLVRSRQRTPVLR